MAYPQILPIETFRWNCFILAALIILFQGIILGYLILFNRFAQAAGPGLNAPSDEGKKGWRDEGEDRWKVEGRRHERMKGPLDERMKGRMDEWVQGRREKWIKGCRDEGKNVWKDEGKNRYMDVGRKGRTKGWKEEVIDPTSERKGPEQSNIDPRIYKKRVPKSTKMVPKSPQKGPKTNQERQKIRATSSRRSWTPLGGDFPAIGSWSRALLESKIKPNS